MITVNNRNELIFAVRDALKQSFRETIEALRPEPVTFAETKVTMPDDAIWTRYAVAAVKAYESATGTEFGR